MNENELIQILQREKHFNHILYCIHKILKENAMLCAGYIQQVYWNYCHGYALQQDIKDVDICYFSIDDNENDMIDEFKKIYVGDIPLDIKNQTYVHKWYEKKYGHPIKPYTSLKDAIDTFPTTTTTIGICKSNNEYEVYTTYGLDDLFNIILRPNKKQITKSIYQKYCDKIGKRFPMVTTVEWDGN